MTGPALRRTTLLTLAACWLVLVLGGSARAAEYAVVGCHDASGAISIDGWSKTATQPAIANSYDYCATQGYFGSSVARAAVPNGSEATWTFNAPPDTTISAYSMYRFAASNSGPGWNKGYALYEEQAADDGSRARENCFRSSGCAQLGSATDVYSANNLVRVSRVRLRRVIVAAQCISASACGELQVIPGAQFAIYAVHVWLRDDAPPFLPEKPSGGPFSGSAELSGTTGISWRATDQGGGLARVGLLVDGRGGYERPADPAHQECSPVTRVVVPCPLTAHGTLSLDTTKLPDGRHTVQLYVRDVAGNETRSRAESMTVVNHPVPNGFGASRAVRLTSRFGRRSSATVRFRHSRSVVGRLMRLDGRPVAGATIAVLSRTTRPGARAKLVGAVRTNAKGRYVYKPRRGPSRKLAFAYRAFSTDARNAAKSSVRLRVRAGLSFRISPRHLRNGDTMVMTGRLLGGPGRRGTLVTLRVLNPRRQTFLTVHADRRGRFRATYRFRYTLQRTRFRFRALVQQQAGYPYIAGGSRAVGVTVRP
jgi:hypothetical protein